MSSRAKKLRNRMARQVVDGKISVAEARARLGQSAAQGRGTVQKSAGATWTPPAEPRYAGDEQYIKSAFRPLARPVITKAAAQTVRETPLQELEILKSLQVPATGRAPHYWTSADLAELREINNITDPSWREQARSGLIRRIEGNAT